MHINSNERMKAAGDYPWPETAGSRNPGSPANRHSPSRTIYRRPSGGDRAREQAPKRNHLVCLRDARWSRKDGFGISCLPVVAAPPFHATEGRWRTSHLAIPRPCSCALCV